MSEVEIPKQGQQFAGKSKPSNAEKSQLESNKYKIQMLCKISRELAVLHELSLTEPDQKKN